MVEGPSLGRSLSIGRESEGETVVEVERVEERRGVSTGIVCQRRRDVGVVQQSDSQYEVGVCGDSPAQGR